VAFDNCLALATGVAVLSYSRLDGTHGLYC